MLSYTMFVYVCRFVKCAEVWVRVCVCVWKIYEIFMLLWILLLGRILSPVIDVVIADAIGLFDVAGRKADSTVRSWQCESATIGVKCSCPYVPRWLNDWRVAHSSSLINILAAKYELSHSWRTRRILRSIRQLWVNLYRHFLLWVLLNILRVI